MQRLLFSALLIATATAQAQGSTPQPAPQPPTLTMDAASKTVKVKFVAGHGSHNNGLNYNGDAKGEKTLTVPLGWTVEVGLSNAGKMPHDFAVVAGTALPASPFTARLAFPNAATSVLAAGAPAPTSTTFVANRPGTYFILCRVGKHAQNGMYLKLNVVNGVKTATYQ